jgi:hypothetical protein
MKQERNVPAFFIDVWRGKAPVHEHVQIQLIVAKCTERIQLIVAKCTETHIWCCSACQCVHIQLIVAKCTETHIWCCSACHGRHEGQKIEHAFACLVARTRL